MGVSENRGTPKSSILKGISIINRPFWGTTIFGNTHIHLYIYIYYNIYVEVDMLTYAHKQNACADQICDGFYFWNVYRRKKRRVSICTLYTLVLAVAGNCLNLSFKRYSFIGIPY